MRACGASRWGCHSSTRSSLQTLLCPYRSLHAEVLWRRPHDRAEQPLQVCACWASRWGRHSSMHSALQETAPTEPRMQMACGGTIRAEQPLQVRVCGASRWECRWSASSGPRTASGCCLRAPLGAATSTMRSAMRSRGWLCQLARCPILYDFVVQRVQGFYSVGHHA